MRILLYNWVQFDDVERRGGGVRVYQKNLIDHLVHHTDHEVTVISGGLEHDAFDKHFFIERTDNEYGDRVASYTMVNSPVLAPGHPAFGSAHVFDESELPAWHAFLREGRFDVVQFDTLEGIPMPFVKVHDALPDARVGVYFHNYYPVCPQVNLWKRESQRCVDYRDGVDCVSCLMHETPRSDTLRAHQFSRILRRSGVTPQSLGYRLAYKVWGRLRVQRTRAEKVSKAVRKRLEARQGRRELARIQRADADITLRVPTAGAGDAPVSLKLVDPDTRNDPAAFKQRRELTAELINTHADVVLATSERVREVIAARGIARDRIEVNYIGTAVANDVDPSRRRRQLQVPGQLTMAYLGYMRADKGFFFLLDALEQAPPELLGRLRLVIGAKMQDEPQLERRLQALAMRMQDLLHVDGYQHDQLDSLLAPVDVGLVPVQWEDNLPQVAIEMNAHGLPLVTSDLGGAQELGGHASGFTFQATDTHDFLATLAALADGDTSLDSYWDNAIELTSMTRHVTRLLDLYDDAGVRRTTS